MRKGKQHKGGGTDKNRCIKTLTNLKQMKIGLILLSKVNKARKKLIQTPLIHQFTIAYELIRYKLIQILKKTL